MNLRCTLALLLAAVAHAAAGQTSRCKEPMAADAKLAEGLRLYEGGNWRASYDQLARWAKAPDAAKDPAAGRGFYALSYALRMSGKPLEAAPWTAQAQAALERVTESERSIEGFYYLASIADSRQASDEVARLAKRAIAEGACGSPDGDDLFRLARLNVFAGNADEGTRLMTLAAEALAAGKGRVVTYQPLAHSSLAAELVAQKKHAEALTHLRKAADLDPSLPRIHRAVGLTMLRLGDVAGAGAYWRAEARPAVDGDDIDDATLLLERVVSARSADGAAAAASDLATLERAALDQRARETSAAWLDLSRKAGRSQRSPEVVAAERRVLDVMMEYLQRGENVTRIVQANGVTRLLHAEAARTPRSKEKLGR